MEFLGVLGFLGVVAVIIGIRLALGGMDKDRVDEYIANRGGRVIKKEWNPFGKGWFGGRDSRIYELIYEDKDGNTHHATCKTSMWSGVYFTEDIITQYSQNRPSSPADLQAENLRLRVELEQLKKQTKN